MSTINLSKHIWEGWTVGDFIEALEPLADMIQESRSWKKPMTSRAELKAWCKDNQPYCKKYIPDVVNYFAKKYKLS